MSPLTIMRSSTLPGGGGHTLFKIPRFVQGRHENVSIAHNLAGRLGKACSGYELQMALGQKERARWRCLSAPLIRTRQAGDEMTRLGCARKRACLSGACGDRAGGHQRLDWSGTCLIDGGYR